MLTNPRDLVLDPFAGSCVTGEACEKMRRRWIGCEIDKEYVEGSKGRFSSDISSSEIKLRDKPYVIFPPNGLKTGEAESTLLENGGRR